MQTFRLRKQVSIRTNKSSSYYRQDTVINRILQDLRVS
jgi:hypothetical protein